MPMAAEIRCQGLEAFGALERRHFRLKAVNLFPRLLLCLAIRDHHEFIAAGSIRHFFPKDARDQLCRVLQVFVALFHDRVCRSSA